VVGDPLDELGDLLLVEVRLPGALKLCTQSRGRVFD